jgi:hypothetical protein
MNMKRYALVCAALAILLAACENDYRDTLVPVYRAYAYGTPMAIAADLAKIGYDDDYPLDGIYYLAADIDLSAYESWTPIGDAATPFTGTLNGNGKTIRGLKLGGGTAPYTGLFGYIQNARISNVTIELGNDFDEPVAMTATANQWIGVVAGYSASSNVNAVKVTAAEGKGLYLTKATSNSFYAGGIAGQTAASIVNGAAVHLNLKIEAANALYAGLVSGDNYTVRGFINSCSADGSMDISVKGGSVYAGGIAGQSGVGLENCVSAVSDINVSLAGPANALVGGIVGLGPAVLCGIRSDRPVTIRVAGATTANGSIYVGGISGGNYRNGPFLGDSATISRCFVDAPAVSITAESDNANIYAGGIAGMIDFPVMNSYIRRGEVLAKMTGTNTTGNKITVAGGIIGNISYISGSDGVISNCFSGADVTAESAWVPLFVHNSSLSAVTAAGGIAGFIERNASIKNSGASGKVRTVNANAGTNGKVFAGGLAGVGIYMANQTFTIERSVALNDSAAAEYGANTAPHANRIVGAAGLSGSNTTTTEDATSGNIDLRDNYAKQGMEIKKSGDYGITWTVVYKFPNNVSNVQGSDNMERKQYFFESIGWDFNTDWEWDAETDMPIPRIR